MATPPSTDAVWSQLSAELRCFIRRRVADDHMADDLLQETFLRIHRNVDSLVEADRLAAWVYRIARNVVHDHYRRRAKKEVPLEDVASNECDDGPGPLPSHASGWLRELIGQLPEKYREAVQLAEIDGRTQQQVAGRLGLSLSGAKSRIQRGRAMLKDALDRCCTFEFDRRGNMMGCDPKPDRTVCRECDEWDGPSASSS